jgi:hypothetical protein
MHPSLEVGGKHLAKEAGNEMRKAAVSDSTGRAVAAQENPKVGAAQVGAAQVGTAAECAFGALDAASACGVD